jgi:integrase
VASRRGAREGSIFRRQDGRWVAMLDLGWQDGRRRRRSFMGRTRGDVAEQLSAALASRQAGLPVGANRRQTVEQYLIDWLGAKQRIRVTTALRYDGLARRHLLPRLGRVRLTDLAPSDVERMMRSMVEEGLSPRTAMHARGVLRTALHDAQRDGLLARNVAALARPIGVPERKVQVLSPDQVRDLLARIDADPLAPLVAFAIGTGGRLGEALALRWQDVADDYSTVAFTHGVYRGQLVPLKTEKSRRTLPLPRLVQAALKRQRLRATPSPDGFVFTSNAGTPQDQTNVGHQWRRLQASIGWESPLRFHDLRHQSASLLLAGGADLRTVMGWLGHSQITLTANTYAHLLPQVKVDAAERMDALLGF